MPSSSHTRQVPFGWRFHTLKYAPCPTVSFWAWLKRTYGPVSQPIVVVGRVEVNSPLRNESAALPIELVIVGKGAAGQR